MKVELQGEWLDSIQLDLSGKSDQAEVVPAAPRLGASPREDEAHGTNEPSTVLSRSNPRATRRASSAPVASVETHIPQQEAAETKLMKSAEAIAGLRRAIPCGVGLTHPEFRAL